MARAYDRSHYPAAQTQRQRNMSTRTWQTAYFNSDRTLSNEERMQLADRACEAASSQ
jgi:hypothetical protein